MIRIWLVAALMGLSVSAAWLLTPGRPAAEEEGPALETMVPAVIGEWRIDESVPPVLPRTKDEAKSLSDRIYDRTLVRTYRNSRNDRIMLVIAYGRDQSDALQLHLPEVCYASQGFAVTKAGRASVELSGGTALPVVRLETRRGRRHEPVTYWTRVGERIVRSRLSRQWAKLAYGLRGKVPDGVLIRVSTISKHTGRAFAIHDRFVRQLLQAVPPSHRGFFLGRTGA